MARTPVLRTDVQRFLAQARQTELAQRQPSSTRIIFAMDATASREPTWDLAMSLHAELFQAAGSATADAAKGDATGKGRLAIQLAHYRGFNEFHASRWSTSPPELLAEMTSVRCRGGLTQIGRVLDHAQTETKRQRVKALVFVGDACEEDHDAVAGAAGQLALFNLPCFIFQEGRDARARRVFRDIAHITKGAHSPFVAGSADQLRALFGAVAAYAAHGRGGIDRIEHAVARGLLAQLPP